MPGSMPSIFGSLRRKRSHRPGLRSTHSATQRGKRSHIGLAGFLLGGWIFDRGQSSGTDRWMYRKSPSDWRVILAQPNFAETIHGDQEAKMFLKSETQANPHRAEMIAMIESKILPGLECQSLQQVDQPSVSMGDLPARSLRGPARPVPFEGSGRSDCIDERSRFVRLWAIQLGSDSFCHCVFAGTSRIAASFVAPTIARSELEHFELRSSGCLLSHPRWLAISTLVNHEG